MLGLVERWIKGPLFGCRMCGNCLLQETAFICPMECPKGIRNGPCGGSTEDHCYVDETRPCIWYRIYDRAFRMHRQELLHSFQFDNHTILNHSKCRLDHGLRHIVCSLRDRCYTHLS